MSQFYLINKIRYGTRVLHPGALLDSMQDDTAGIAANGGFLVASSDATVAAAAAIAQTLSLRGQWQEAAFIMMAAAAKSSTGDDIVANLASTATGKGSALIGDEDPGGLYTATTVGGQLQEAKVLIDSLVGAVKRTVTVAFNNAAFVAANSNGTAAVVNIGATLPANARIAYADAHGTVYAGGSIASISMKIGTSGDDDAIVSASDLVSAFVDGGPSTFTRGIRPNKLFATVGAQLIATFTPDGSHQLANLTSGSLVVDVWYFVAA